MRLGAVMVDFLELTSCELELVADLNRKLAAEYAAVDDPEIAHVARVLADWRRDRGRAFAEHAAQAEAREVAYLASLQAGELEAEDPAAPARGIVNALIGGIGLWALVALVILIGVQIGAY